MQSTNVTLNRLKIFNLTFVNTKNIEESRDGGSVIKYRVDEENCFRPLTMTVQQKTFQFCFFFPFLRENAC